MVPLHGHARCTRGKRLIGKGPHGRWRTMNVIAALRLDGLDAACAFQGPINRENLIPNRCPSQRPNAEIVIGKFR